MKMQVRWVLLSFALLGAAMAGASITTDYDHKVNFINFKTYSWGKLETTNSIWDERVKTAVDGALASKGWTLVSDGGDVMVNAFGKTHPEHTLNTFYDSFGGGWRWRGFGDFGEATTTIDTYQVGTVIIDMFNSKTKNLIWRGVATDMLSGNPEKNTKRLNGEVHRMFQHFPPGPSR